MPREGERLGSGVGHADADLAIAASRGHVSAVERETTKAGAGPTLLLLQRRQDFSAGGFPHAKGSVGFDSN